MKVLFKIAAIFAFVLVIVAGINWVFWLLWCWVMPQLWVGGPENITKPSWLLFFVTAILVSWVGRVIFGVKNKSE